MRGISSSKFLLRNGRRASLWGWLDVLGLLHSDHLLTVIESLLDVKLQCVWVSIHHEHLVLGSLRGLDQNTHVSLAWSCYFLLFAEMLLEFVESRHGFDLKFLTLLGWIEQLIVVVRITASNSAWIWMFGWNCTIVFILLLIAIGVVRELTLMLDPDLFDFSILVLLLFRVEAS